VRFFFTRRVPDYDRVLLVESGSRSLIENLIPVLYERFGDRMTLDLVTCYPGAPKGFREDRGTIFRTFNYAGSSERKNLYRELKARGYSILGMICSDEPIMTKWKWMLAWQIPAKVFILNENGDYFYLDRSQWRTMVYFGMFRAGLVGEGAVRTVAGVVVFPFTLAYLLLYAAVVHLRRKVRQLT
jgi:hypothetical protein